MATYSSLPNKLVSAANGIDYAYRDAGEGAVPLVLLQHFRGNLDNWDPALIDALASARRVVVKPRSAIRRLSPSMVCATDLLPGLVITPSEDCVLSGIRLPFEVRRSCARLREQVVA
jgi:pimeloyl-ACP methyl ester carboxylesterase